MAPTVQERDNKTSIGASIDSKDFDSRVDDAIGVVMWLFPILALGGMTVYFLIGAAQYNQPVAGLAVLLVGGGMTLYLISGFSKYYNKEIAPSKKRRLTSDNQRTAAAYSTKIRPRLMENTREMQEQLLGGSHIPRQPSRGRKGRL
jgi:hypothetical protein